MISSSYDIGKWVPVHAQGLELLEFPETLVLLPLSTSSHYLPPQHQQPQPGGGGEGGRRRREEERRWGRGKRGKWVGERREGRGGEGVEGEGVERKGRRTEEVTFQPPPLQASNSSQLGNSCSESWKKTVCRPVTTAFPGFQMINNQTTLHEPWRPGLLSQGVAPLWSILGPDGKSVPTHKTENKT